METTTIDRNHIAELHSLLYIKTDLPYFFPDQELDHFWEVWDSMEKSDQIKVEEYCKKHIPGKTYFSILFDHTDFVIDAILTQLDIIQS